MRGHTEAGWPHPLAPYRKPHGHPRGHGAGDGRHVGHRRRLRARAGEEGARHRARGAHGRAARGHGGRAARPRARGRDDRRGPRRPRRHGAGRRAAAGCRPPHRRARQQRGLRPAHAPGDPRPRRASARLRRHDPRGLRARRRGGRGHEEPRSRRDHQRRQRLGRDLDERVLGDQGLGQHLQRGARERAARLRGHGDRPRAGMGAHRVPSTRGPPLVEHPGVPRLDAEYLVERCLRDADRGRVISIPSVRFQVLTWFTRHLPAASMRAVSRRIALRRRDTVSP